MGFFLRKSWIWWVLAALLATLLTWLLNWWRHRGGAAAASASDEELRSARGLVDTHKSRITELEGELAAHKKQLAEHKAQVADLDGKVAGFATLSADHDGHKQRADALAAELEAIKASAAGDAARIASLEAEVARRVEPLPPLDLAAAAAVIGSPVKMDDLEVVEGIGPKISELINGNGINTWSGLARTDTSHLRKILDDGGSSYRVADPASWPHQAALLSNGRWTEFKALTDELVAGRYVTGGNTGPVGLAAVPAEPPVPSAEQLEEGSAIVGTKLVLDDLKVVEGIGPAIEGLLQAGGVTTWRQLETAPADRLKAILEAAGSRFAMHDPTTWPRQAGLLADAKWAEFKALTDELDGGRAV
ncbi:MAG: hypothetical protein AB7V43_07465 [Acidimicrobiia bacterium]